MLNITGNDVKLWLDEHQGKNGTFYTYSISVSKKDAETNSWINKTIKVFFAKAVQLPSNLRNGDMFSFEGFPTVDTYINKDGNEVRNIAIVITKAHFGYADENTEQPNDREWAMEDEVLADSFEQAEEDIPF